MGVCGVREDIPHWLSVRKGRVVRNGAKKNDIKEMYPRKAPVRLA